MNNPNHHPSTHSSFASVLQGFGVFFRGLAWLLIALIIAAGVGRLVIRNNRPANNPTSLPTTPTPVPLNWALVDADVREAIIHARTAATRHADLQLKNWVNGLRLRMDEHFLDWYFRYWTQKEQGFKALRYWIQSTRPVEIFIGEQPEVVERITEDIQVEFAQRVLRPVIAQSEIERMTRSTVEIYVTELQNGITPIQGRHKIPQLAWDRYLNDLALITVGRGMDTTPITMKTLAASTIGVSASTMAVLYHALRERMAAVGAKFCAKNVGAGAGKAAAATAAKSGAAASAKLGSKLLGPIVLAGVVVWDVWDHNRSRNINEPILRKNLNDYLDLLQQSLLDDPAGGILTVVTEIEQNLHRSLNRR